MSWGTCYNGSNNIHFNFPPIMDDGRNYSSYDSTVALDNIIKKKANIVTNTDYRRYLQVNADSIIKNNQLSSCNECSSCPYSYNRNNSQNNSTNTPYIFNSILSQDQPYGYENSNLKNIYLSRQQLESQLYTPQIKIDN